MSARSTRSMRALLHALVEHGAHAGEGASDAGVVLLADPDRQAGVDGDVGDARAHEPAAEHAHALHRARLHRGIGHAVVLLEGGLGEEDLHEPAGHLRHGELAEEPGLAPEPLLEPLLVARAARPRGPSRAPGSGRGSSRAAASAPGGRGPRGRASSPRGPPAGGRRGRAAAPSSRPRARAAAAPRSASSCARRRATSRRRGAGTTSSTRPSLSAFLALTVLPARMRSSAVGDADEARQPLRAAGAGDEAELHLGQAELRLRVVGGDAVVAGERPLEAAAQAGAVDGGHHRLREALQPVEAGLARRARAPRRPRRSSPPGASRSWRRR